MTLQGILTERARLITADLLIKGSNRPWIQSSVNFFLLCLKRFTINLLPFCQYSVVKKGWISIKVSLLACVFGLSFKLIFDTDETPWNIFLSIPNDREVLVNGKAQCGQTPCNNKFGSATFYIENIKTSYLNEEDKCSEPSPIVGIPSFSPPWARWRYLYPAQYSPPPFWGEKTKKIIKIVLLAFKISCTVTATS
jgi:hypothetical protein